MPNPQCQQEGDDRAEQDGDPCGDAKGGQKHQKEDDGNQRNGAGDQQASRGVEYLCEHRTGPIDWCQPRRLTRFEFRSDGGTIERVGRLQDSGINACASSDEDESRNAARRLVPS
jgi:hypothetical protein